MEESRVFPRLETERLILREMTLDDLGFYFYHFNNQKIVEGSCFPEPKNIDAAKKELELYCLNPLRENRGIRWGARAKIFLLFFPTGKNR